MTEKVRDRDYILDTDGNYLRIVGDYHPAGTVVSYVKYFPSVHGVRMIRNKLYGYNSFVAKSFIILKECDDRIIFSHRHGGIITTTPETKIREYFSCRKKIQQIVSQKDIYSKHPVGKYLIDFLDLITDAVDLRYVGITGSFLIGAENKNSDIDLVCYGEKTYQNLKLFFEKKTFIQRYENELANILFARRMIHMAAMDFDTLILQESRKLQGVIRGTDIHINCQPLRLDDDTSMDLNLMEIGDISCVAQILDDSQGGYSPAYYRIEVLSIVNSIFADAQFKEKITVMLSFIGVFSQSFKTGDKVFLEGKLVRIIKHGKTCFGVELSPWNTDRVFKAVLLR